MSNILRALERARRERDQGTAGKGDAPRQKDRTPEEPPSRVAAAVGEVSSSTQAMPPVVPVQPHAAPHTTNMTLAGILVFLGLALVAASLAIVAIALTRDDDTPPPQAPTAAVPGVTGAPGVLIEQPDEDASLVPATGASQVMDRMRSSLSLPSIEAPQVELPAEPAPAPSPAPAPTAAPQAANGLETQRLHVEDFKPFRITGIFMDTNEPLVTIAGRQWTVGDVVEGYRIEKVTEDVVTLSRDGTTYEVKF